MSVPINDNFQNKSPKPIDSRYGKFSGGTFVPYASAAEANSLIPMAYRFAGLTVLISEGGAHKEYAYQGGIADANLTYKLPDIARRQKKVGHGYSVGLAIYKDGSQVWTRSNGNSLPESCVYGVVTKVLDADNFILGRDGDIFTAPAGLLPLTDYYLDTTLSGINYTKDPPVNSPGKFVKKIFRTNAAGEAIIEIEPGFQVASNSFPESKTVANFAAATQGSTPPRFYEVIADETNGGAPTLYFWSGSRMFRLSTFGTTTTTTSGTTTTTTTAGTTTTTTAGTTTTTTTNGTVSVSRRFYLNFSRQPGFTITEAPSPPWNNTTTQYPVWTNANDVGKTNMITDTGAASTVSCGNLAGMAGVGGIDLNIPQDTGVWPNVVIAVVGGFVHNTGFRFSGLDNGKLYKAYIHFDNSHYESKVVWATCNGKGTTPVGSTPLSGGAPTLRESAGNHGAGNGSGLANTSLDYIDTLQPSSGNLDFIFSHQSGGTNSINVSSIVLEEYTIVGTTTTTTAATTTTTTTAGTTTTTAATTTTTTAATTTTTTTATYTVLRTTRLNFSRQPGYTATEAPTPPWNNTQTGFESWLNAGGVGVNNMVLDNGVSSIISASNPQPLSSVEGIDLNVAVDTGVWISVVIGVVGIFTHGQVYRFFNLDDTKYYNAYIHFDNHHYESKIVGALCNGKGNTPVGSTPASGTPIVWRESAGNHGAGAGTGLANTSLDFIKALQPSGGILDFTMQHQSGGTNTIKVTSIVLEETNLPAP